MEGGNLARPGSLRGGGARPAVAAQPARNGSAAAPRRDALQPPPRAPHPSLRRARSRGSGGAAGSAPADRARLAPRTLGRRLPSPARRSSGHSFSPEERPGGQDVPRRPAPAATSQPGPRAEERAASRARRGRAAASCSLEGLRLPGRRFVRLQPRSELARQPRVHRAGAAPPRDDSSAPADVPGTGRRREDAPRARSPGRLLCPPDLGRSSRPGPNMLDGLKMEENFQSAIETSASFSSLLGRAVSPKSVCEGCQRVISDRFLLRLNDGFWHEQCVQCASCKEPLETTCFYRDKKLYCKYDYENFLVDRD